MKVINSAWYRYIGPSGVNIEMENVDRLLDAGLLEVAMGHGKWWKIRRNGQTKRWKKDVNRIRIPIKFGWRGHGAITEHDFVEV